MDEQKTEELAEPQKPVDVIATETAQPTETIEPDVTIGSETKFQTLKLNEDKRITVKERAIESVKSTNDAPDTTKLNMKTPEALLPVLSDLSLEQLVSNCAQIDQQSQFLKGLILLEARNRFASNNDFSKWVKSVGSLCSDTRQAHTRYMNFARYFTDKNQTGISLTCCYEISAPINADVADMVYDFALNKNLSVAQVKKQIQIAKGLLASNVTEIIEKNDTPELLPPEDISRFKEQVLLAIAGLAQHDAVRVLRACVKEIEK